MILRQGDILPTVAVTQYFLNLYASQQLEMDGILGDNTTIALRQFQRDNGLSASGRLRNATWQKLNQRNWQLVDSVDITDDENLDVDYRDYGPRNKFGPNTILNYGMTNGVRNVINQVRSQSQSGRVVLLRFHGHGFPGHQIVSSGESGDHRSSFDLDYGGNFWPLFASMRPIFSAFGSVEFHGCNVARGVRGTQFLRKVAQTLNVPATAGVPLQYGGIRRSQRFEGRTKTFCPNDLTIREWARQTMSTCYY